MRAPLFRTQCEMLPLHFVLLLLLLDVLILSLLLLLLQLHLMLPLLLLLPLHLMSPLHRPLFVLPLLPLSLLLPHIL